jgi:hypothetical protein
MHSWRVRAKIIRDESTANRPSCLFGCRGLSGGLCWVDQADITEAGYGRHAWEPRRGVDATATNGAQLSPTDVSATRDSVLPADAGSDISTSPIILTRGVSWPCVATSHAPASALVGGAISLPSG